MRRAFQALTLAALSILSTATLASAEVLFWSTQGSPVEETQKMRKQVLAGFPGSVDFQGRDDGPFTTRLQAEIQAGKGTIGVIGALHGDLSSYADQWADLSDVDLAGIKVTPALMQLGKLGTDQQKYLPWMQATFVMAANKKALQFLPKGADINALTYDQLIDWAKAMEVATGSPKFGIPAGPNGLKHRFFEGFLIPAYTGSEVTKFRSADAEKGWSKFRELWQYTNPASTNYDFMYEPLLRGDVWVAFDHIALLGEAFKQKPDDFVAFPAPAGPHGRAYMPVVAGLAVPKWAPDMKSSKALIRYMMQPETQIATLLATNFFPVTDATLPPKLPAAAIALGKAVSDMTNAPDALPSLLPVGLGENGGKFNQVYVDTFERAVLGGQDLHQVLEDEAGTLRTLMQDTGAHCWAPDAPSNGPCPVE